MVLYSPKEVLGKNIKGEEMKNLSKEFVDVKEEYRHCNNPIREFGNVLGGELGSITAIVPDVDGVRDYYTFDVNSQKAIMCRKSSDIKMYRVENGIFKDDICIIEKTFNGKTFMSVTHENGVFKYPEMKRHATDAELDNLLNDDVIQKLILDYMLKPKDKASNRQQFEILCDGLPKRVWQNTDFTSNLFDSVLEITDKNLADYAIGCEVTDEQDDALNYVIKKIDEAGEATPAVEMPRNK